VSAGDLAAVIVSVVMIAAIVTLALAVQAMLRTLRELRGTLEALRGEAVPLMGELRTTVERAGAEVDRVDDLLETAESISATVDSASRLGYLAFRAPIIRVVALGKGITRGTRRLAGRAALDAKAGPRAIERPRRPGRRDRAA
jgi:hypothetical protein